MFDAKTMAAVPSDPGDTDLPIQRLVDNCRMILGRRFDTMARLPTGTDATP